MSNELTALPELPRTLFKHGFILLPWFCRIHPRLRLRVIRRTSITDYVEAIRNDAVRFFGPHDDLASANDSLAEFYHTVRPAGGARPNRIALGYLEAAWIQAWQSRKSLQLRGVEIRLMKFFHEIFCLCDLDHLAELVSMARLMDRWIVRLARSIVFPGGRSLKKNFSTLNRQLVQLRQRLFASTSVSPELQRQMAKRKPRQYKEYQKLVRDRREAARLRIIEIFDEEDWFPIVDSAVVLERLTAEGMEDLLPRTFHGRVSVQPTGYPLTFYTYAGLELEKPPLYGVEMNSEYGRREPEKKYRIHPVNDGTYYCTTRAVIGDSLTKHYTLEYKRRARKLKYESVRSLGSVINDVRRRMMDHVHCDHRSTWVRALMCIFMDETCARIGNSQSAQGEHRAFGVTTFRTREHVKIQPDRILITYPGKHQQIQEHVIRKSSSTCCGDAVGEILYDKLMKLIQEKREYIFTQENGKPYGPEQVNEYFTSHSPSIEMDLPFGGAGSPCTVHHFRNYHATEMFREFVRSYNHRCRPTYDDLLLAYQGRKSSKTKHKIEGILDRIAKKLGNTPAICRRAYIDPLEQLLFFRRWGYRPPESIIRDLFVQEEMDSYGLEEILQSQDSIECMIESATSG